MTEDDIRALAKTSLEEAVEAATLFGMIDLALELTTRAPPAKKKKPAPNVFGVIRNACFNMTDLSLAIRVPRSTVAAAAQGRILGGTNHYERLRIAKFLHAKRDAIDAALAMVEEPAA